MNSFLLTAENGFDAASRLRAVWRHWHPSGCVDPLWIVVPDTPTLYHFKREALRSGLSAFGVEFLTPSNLRHRLAELLGLPKPSLRGREETEFLFRQVARRHASDATPVLQSLSRQAAPLCEALDQLSAAGHSPDVLPLLSQYPRFRDDLKALLASDTARDRNALDEELRSRSLALSKRLPLSVILLGFGVEHSLHARVLETLAHAASQVAVILEAPNDQDETLQFTWNLWWQRLLPGASEVAPGETNELSEPTMPIREFYLADSQQHQLNLLETLVCDEVGKLGPLEKMAVVFPETNALTFALAARLRARGIPYYSDFPESGALLYEQSVLRAWLELQRNGLTCDDLLTFWRAVESNTAFFEWLGDTSLSGKIAHFLDKTYGRSAVDDVSFLTRFHLKPNDVPPALGTFVSRWDQLCWTEETSLSERLETLRTQWTFLVGEHLGQQLRTFVEERLAPLAQSWTASVPRTDFIDLLESLLLRAPESPAAMPWAPVQLLQPARARTQTWSAVILAGLNEGAWPGPLPPSPFLSDSLWTSLQEDSREASPHAPDEKMFRPGFAPLLTEKHHYALQRAQFYYLLDNTTRVHLVTTEWDELDAKGEAYVSELFREAWKLEHPNWNPETVQSLKQNARLKAPVHLVTGELHPATGRAYAERQDRSSPFGPYQFTISEPLPVKRLAPTTAEKVLKDPASAWFQYFLEAPADDPVWEDAGAFHRVSGYFLHAAVSQSFVASTNAAAEDWLRPLPSEAAWTKTLSQLFAQWESDFREASRGRFLVWNGEWPRLQHQALKLVRHVCDLARSLEWPQVYAASELNFKDLPVAETIQMPLQLPWSGRIDFLLTNHAEPEHANQLFVLDFKTGSSGQPFKADVVQQKAELFQLVAYARLLRPHFDPNCLIYPATVTRSGLVWKAENPIDVTGAEWTHLWKVLEAAWTRGCYAQTRSVHKAFNDQDNSRLPLATLEVPLDILAAKWKQTPVLQDWPRFEKKSGGRS
jgi:hypothetical protein